MKGRFAKTVEVEGYQVLVRGGVDDEGDPAIVMTMKTREGFIDIAVAFDSNETDDALEVRDAVLEAMLDDDDNPMPRRAFEEIRDMGVLDDDAPRH